MDFLPRSAFLGPVLQRASGADAARARVAQEAEDVTLTFLPGQINLPDGAGVRADAFWAGPGTLVLIEAKGPGRASFNPAQLSREYRAVLQQANGRTPLLLLILGGQPPVRVKKRLGTHEIAGALEWELGQLPDDVVGGAAGREQLVAGVPAVLAWTTWKQIAHTVADALDTFTVDDPSVLAAVHRLAQDLLTAVAWHTRAGA